MRVVSVTVNFRTAKLALRATEAALADLRPMGGKALLVDNASGDGSPEVLAEAIDERGWAAGAHLLTSEKNVGFGAGNNIAFRHAMTWDDPPEYFYLLNPDACPDPGAIETLVRFMDDNPRVGIAGSLVRHEDGQLRTSAFRFPSVLSELEAGAQLGVVSRLLERWRVPARPPESTCEVDWVSGASVILRRSMLEEIGLFDESFFLYFEETDLCLRAKRAGWQTYYVVEAGAEHIGQVSTGMKDKQKRRPKFWFESRSYYLRKNYGPLKLLAANTAFAGAYSIYAFRTRFLGKEDRDPPRFYRDFLDFNFRGDIED